MDFHTQSSAVPKLGEGNPGQRMYINPHFNQQYNVKQLQTVTHFNPNFYHQPQGNHQTTSNVKIFINPKFVTANGTIASRIHDVRELNVVSSDRESKAKSSNEIEPTVSAAVPRPQCSMPISQSRYSIVRSKNVPKVPGSSNSSEFSKVTVVMSKYKSVHINNVKKALESSNIKTTSQPNVKTAIISKVLPTNNKNKYKLVKTSAVSSHTTTNAKCKNKYKVVKTQNKTAYESATRKACLNNQTINSRFKYYSCADTNVLLTTNLNSSVKKKYKNDKVNSRFKYYSCANANIKVGTKLNISTNKPKHRERRIVEICKLKKNNIPCPLFRKYGKCIRKEKGKCNFLHDKKHLSICRKFIKGLCHDTACLLSHDLTTKKMPTCHFYLKGMCIKTDCPYLHVKLNDNATICDNFLKGYCDSGDKCLKRHVNVCPKVTRKRNKEEVSSEASTSTSVKVDEPNDVDLDLGNRYYRAKAVEPASPTHDTDTEVMKPSRCKLGTLPSYIKL